jgi:hypothetical protein
VRVGGENGRGGEAKKEFIKNKSEKAAQHATALFLPNDPYFSVFFPFFPLYAPPPPPLYPHTHTCSSPLSCPVLMQSYICICISSPSFCQRSFITRSSCIINASCLKSSPTYSIMKKWGGEWGSVNKTISQER